MRNDNANDRRRRVPLIDDSDAPFVIQEVRALFDHEDYCHGCGVGMPYTPTAGQNRAVRIWCDQCVLVVHQRGPVTLVYPRFECCPRCKTETKNLHPDDGLCPQCEGEWAHISTHPLCGCEVCCGKD